MKTPVQLSARIDSKRKVGSGSVTNRRQRLKLRRQMAAAIKMKENITKVVEEEGPCILHRSTWIDMHLNRKD